jgi:hypothetical protein
MADGGQQERIGEESADDGDASAGQGFLLRVPMLAVTVRLKQ